MLKNTLSLTKIMLRCLYDAGETKKNKKSKKSSSLKQYIILGIIIFVFLGVPMFFMGVGISAIINEQDPTIQSSLWQVLLPISLILILITSIFSIISVFFFSMDNKILLPLPLNSFEILTARFLTSLILSYSIEIMFLTPLLYGVGVGFEINSIQIIYLTIIQLFLPILPVALCGIVFTLLSRVINFSKHKGLFTYISIIFSVALGVSFSFASSSIPEEDAEIAAALIKTLREAGDSLIKFFPHLSFAISALTEPNLLTQFLYIILFIIINIGMIALFLLIANKPYYKTLKQSDEVQTKRKKISKEELHEKTATTKGVFAALVSSEWKSIVRSPTIFSNTILAVIIIPFILIGPFIFGFSSTGESEGLQELLPFIQNQTIGNSVVLLIMISIILFISSMNMTSSTAISRLGKSSHFVKYIPVKPSTILHSKLFIGFIISTIFSIIIGLVACVIGVINIFDTILLIILSASLNLFDNYIGLALDLRKPQLNWDNEIKAVKNNLNTIWAILISFAIMIIQVIVCIIFSGLSFGGYISFVILLGLSLLGNYLFYKHFNKPAHILFSKL